MDQLSFASLDFAAQKKRTKREVLLAEMAAVVRWGMLEALIESHYAKMGPQGGRRPFPLPVMLRIYCLQQWYMCGRRPRCKRILTFSLRSGASHVCGLIGAAPRPLALM